MSTLLRAAGGWRWRAAGAVTFVVALAARLGVILRAGGIHGIIGYDCGVYFAGADALIHGRLPYRDFTMVHPPGITLALAPFAALTNVMTDWHAFIVATVAFCVLGGVNAVLVLTVCRRLGVGMTGATVAALFYAAWFGSVSGEFEVKLEPLANLFLLCGLLMVLNARGRRATVLAGVVLGLTMTVKIWWVVPVALLVVWYGHRRRSVRAGLDLGAGALAAVVVVCLPFFLADPSGMASSIVTDQLGRPRTASTTSRLFGLSTVRELSRHLSADTRTLASLVFAALVVAVVVLAWRGAAAARVLIVMTVAQLIVLVLAPSWFEYYSDYVAVSLSVTVGAAVASVRRTWRVPGFAMAAGALALTAAVTVAGTAAIRPYAGAAQLTSAVRGERCVMTNVTTLLIRLDALTRGLEDGCPNWIDVSGRRYGPDRPAALRADHTTWAAVLDRYLHSGDAIVLWHHREAGRGTVLARAGGHTVYATRPVTDPDAG